MNNLIFGLFNLGSGEIILIAAIMFLLLVGALILAGLVYLIIRVMHKRSHVPPLHGNGRAR